MHATAVNNLEESAKRSPPINGSTGPEEDAPNGILLTALLLWARRRDGILSAPPMQCQLQVLDLNRRVVPLPHRSGGWCTRALWATVPRERVNSSSTGALQCSRGKAR